MTKNENSTIKQKLKIPKIDETKNSIDQQKLKIPKIDKTENQKNSKLEDIQKYPK